MSNSSRDYAGAAELKLMGGFPPPVDKRVNRSNALLTPPYNRWSYQNMRMLYPSAGIPNPVQPTQITRAIDPGIAGLTVSKPDDSGNPSGESVAMDTHLLETYTDALVVVKGDRTSGRLLWTWKGPAMLSLPAIADVDGDGLAEIVVQDAAASVHCLDAAPPPLGYMPGDPIQPIRCTICRFPLESEEAFLRGSLGRARFPREAE